MSSPTDAISSVEHEIGATGTLILAIPYGSIEIHAVEGSTARVRDVAGHGPLLRAEPGTGMLRVEMVRTRGIVWGRPTAPDLQVEIPIRARLEIDTTTASV
ncbi:MAG TPA: hypothetical protein VMH24_09455, partial [Candidatus Sulfotelmatobacter sp.]|nr:hypothetical protein [Candidatus Sulfotelmatobacter sp.]